MYTSTELQLLRNADPGVQIPGIDRPAGDPLSAASLKPITSLENNAVPGISYDATDNLVRVTAAGATLSGYNFGNATVYVTANNVTIKDCNFTATKGYYAVQVEGGANTTVTNDTFNGGGVPAPLAAWVYSMGTVTVTDNQFIDTPADGLHCFGGGLISGNYFSGAGYTSNGQHPDAIWVTDSTAPLSISDNFIDWTTNPNSDCDTNDCIRITTEEGSVSNVTVSGNFLLGGSSVVDAGNGGTDGTFSKISIAKNYIGFGQYYDFYPGPMTGVTLSGNDIFDYTNPAYSANAWAAYEAAGLPTPNLVVSTAGSTITASSTGPTTLYGSPLAKMMGGEQENNFVGGNGRQYICGGWGANIYTYLSPADSSVLGPDLLDFFDPAKDVIDLSHIDANVTPGVQQNFTFIGTNAFTSGGAQVRYQQDPSDDVTWVQVALAGDASPDMEIEISGLVTLTAANFALTSAQSSADFANGASLSVSPTIRSNGLTETSYANVKGRSYTSYNSIFNAVTLVADDLNLSSSANELDLAGNAVTLTRGGLAESIAAAAGSYSLAYHANETIDAGAAAASFVLSSGFGNETINGFTPSGANADTLKLSISSFSYLKTGMTQAQDLAAVLAQASSGLNSITISDSHGDTLTLPGVTAATLAANLGAVKFV